MVSVLVSKKPRKVVCPVVKRRERGQEIAKGASELPNRGIKIAKETSKMLRFI